MNSMIKMQNINTLYLALAPILSVYVFGNGVSLCLYLIVILVVFNTISGNFVHAIKIRKNEFQWYVSLVVISFLGAAFNLASSYWEPSLFVNNFISLSLFFLALIFCTSNCNVTLFKNIIVFFGVMAALICIVQRIQLLLTGSFYKDVFMPGLEVKRDLDSFSVNRVSSFFTEPAHLSIYLLPIYYLMLKEKKRLLSALLGIGLLFSGSSTGFLLISLLTAVYIIKVASKKIYVVYFFLGLFLVGSGIMYFVSEVMIDNWTKLISEDLYGIRLLGPLQYLSFFDGEQWFFGIGLNQLSSFLQSYGVYLESEWGVEINANYANAIIYMLLCYGIIGFCFFLRYLFVTIKSIRNDYGFVVFALGILLSDQVLFNMNLLYVLTFLILSDTLTNEYNENSIHDSSLVL